MSITNRLRYILLICNRIFATVVIVMGFGFALGGAAHLHADVTRLEEVITTAQKREQSVFDLPMSVVAMGAVELEERRIDNMSDLGFAVPGLTVQDSGTNTRYFIRGVGNIIGSSSLIGIYIDEMPVSANSNFQLDLRVQDLERVEVLKGPQGTLYGQGSLGGTIRFITKKPQLEHLTSEMRIAAAYVENGAPDKRIEGVFNLPLIKDELGLRIAGIYKDVGGWIDQPAADKEDVNDKEMLDIRTKVLWQPSNEFEASAMFAVHRNDTAPIVSSEDENGDFMQALSLLSTPMLDDDYELYNLTLTYDLSNTIRFLSTSSYVNADRHNRMLGDVTSSAPLHVLFTSFPVDTNVFSQELRLSSLGSGHLHWVVGTAYTDSQVDQEGLLSIGLATGLVLVEAPFTLNEASESWAIFGDVSYAVTDALEIGAGLRYFEDERELDNGAATQEDKFDSLSPRVYANLNFTENVKAYASISKGFRSGGFNTLGQPAYDPEEVLTYEIGSKILLQDGRLSAEIAVFHSDYQDYQVTGVLPPPALPFNITSNAGDATVDGVDLRFEWAAAENLTLIFSGNYVDAEFDKINLASSDYSEGDRLDLIPKYSYTLSAHYSFNLYNKPGSARLDYNQKGRSVFVPRSESSDVINILNVQTSWDWDENWSFGVFAKNLLDDRDRVNPGSSIAIRSHPRTVGIEVGMKFD